MSVLVTGATGKVGERLVPRLLQWTGGGGVRLLVRDTERAAPFAGLGAEVVVGDLRDPDDRRKALAGVRDVVHVAAAFRGVPDEEAYAVNRDATLALGTEAADEGVRRFIFTSTNLVYGAGRGRPAVETDEPRADGLLTGAYPRAKAEAERGLLALHRERGLDVRVARLAFVYGDGDPHIEEALRLLPDWAAHQRMQMVHHADVAQALWRLLRVPGADGRIYNVADDAPVSMVELLQLVGAEIPEGMAERASDDPWHGVVSNLRIRDELGFRPLYPSLWTARDAGAL
ncbi:NAD(P)-dependent oxidoreductase [Streptomyces sp. NBC_01808]|uniref:NAD-dependent epimerase/dehydratase family protein n=1 Tax=Streptomyces sp. NBC_01808 TaxID=2975947 RepID=UPI002DD9D5AD|nr:NAD(P)-dependent oxidoreductase [Streptomyces sp. NBC_01808]WSA41483.1 NAD(P)-dependent oxidoreductase [Streptomyces sp. NBC_01808]